MRNLPKCYKHYETRQVHCIWGTFKTDLDDKNFEYYTVIQLLIAPSTSIPLSELIKPADNV